MVLAENLEKLLGRLVRAICTMADGSRKHFFPRKILRDIEALKLFMVHYGSMFWSLACYNQSLPLKMPICLFVRVSWILLGP